MTEIVLAPSFNHVLKDPCDGGIVITADISLVVLEGNWLLLDEEPWRSWRGKDRQKTPGERYRNDLGECD